MRLILTLLFGILTIVECSVLRKTIQRPGIRDRADSLKYLDKYGYNPCVKSVKKISCLTDYTSMLREFQKNHGLKATGKLDSMTLSQMNRPRCGNKDVRVSRMRHSTSKWTRSSLTWSLRSHPKQLSRERATSIIKEAFNIWLIHIPLKITETCATCDADFVIETGSRDHHCPYGEPFDGPGFTLAHAFFPVDGRIHFDADEPWSSEFNKDSYNFLLVAVHEIGHALGLEHSNETSSIMFSTYQLMSPESLLPEYDRQAIQAIYGKAEKGGDGNGDSGGSNDPSINWGKNDWAHGCYFKDNDISIVRVPAERCGPECESHSDCTHFTWNKIDGGTCWLKKGYISKNDAHAHDDHSTICGVVESESEQPSHGISWQGNNWANGCDFNGNDLTNVRVPAEKCGPECDSHLNCTHFTWTKYEGGTCWMKKGRISKKDAIPKRDQTMVCGVVESESERASHGISWRGNNWANGCDFNGNDLTNVRVPAERCGPECDSRPNCTHFTWTKYEGGTCWMKKGRISKKNAIPKRDQTMVCGVSSSS